MTQPPAPRGAVPSPGPRILLVEDDPRFAAFLRFAVEEAGCEPVGPAPTLAAALRLAGEGPRPDGAILDLHLGCGGRSDAVARLLAARGVPFVFATGGTRADLPEGFRDRPLLQKPFGLAALVGALAQALSGRAPSLAALHAPPPAAQPPGAAVALGL